MTMPELFLVCFAAAAVIHGAQVVLVAKLWRHQSPEDRHEAFDGLTIGVVFLLWQAGNFSTWLFQIWGVQDTAVLFRAVEFVRIGSLVVVPLLFSYLFFYGSDIPNPWGLVSLGRFLIYPLIPWTVLALVTLGADEAGYGPILVTPDTAAYVTLHIMLLYFLIFTVVNFQKRQEIQSTTPIHRRAHAVGVVAGVLTTGLLILLLGGYWNAPVPLLPFVGLAAMLTSVPFTIAIAYRLYQFPFMDAFLREVLSGLILLAACIAAFAAHARFLVIFLIYAKAPLTRWVERRFLGHAESVEEQEERIGNAIRALARLDEFNARVSEILRAELDAQWVAIDPEPRPGAAFRFETAGLPGFWLSLGPRLRGRKYMSRELRVARTAALQLASHHHQLSQHELRELTARAQMRALQAQINPHFLFNTLNVLSNLIHSNPARAERVTEELADLFRYALESTRVEWVKLDDELRFLEAYLEIEKARFEERLTYSIEADESIRSMRIAPMVLQPLVENAIKHGVGPMVEGGRVRITGRMDTDHLVLIVEDTGAGPRAASRQRGTGVGLRNVRERLQHLYGEAANLKLEENRPCGTRAVLVLPLPVTVAS